MTHRPVQRAIKRAFDVVASGVGLVVLSPALGGLALAIYLDSGRPVIFVSRRAGLDGHPFGMLKFRTMVPDAIALGRASGISDVASLEGGFDAWLRESAAAAGTGSGR